MTGIVVAGTASGSGKTTISLGLMACLTRMGYQVAPFKVGPDFIDPGHHAALTGSWSRNLDSWMLSKEMNQQIFSRGCRGKDVAVVEGVMGLFDGYSGVSEAGSTSQMARWLGLPVILVVDARRMARSAAAIVKGFEIFDPGLCFAGVIFTRTGSRRHYEYLREAVEDRCDMPCLGHLPGNETLAIPERYLGLVTSDEHPIPIDVLETLVSMIQENIDIKALLKGLGAMETVRDRGWFDPLPGRAGKQPPTDVAAGVDALVPQGRPPAMRGSTGVSAPLVTLAVARDRAFCFYYAENLELLEAAGARLVFFSPLSDRALPENIQGIYLGGGYPELFARDLSRNRDLQRQIREESEQGMPIYGECGGFMYLCEQIIGRDGEAAHGMVGCFPFTAVMSGKKRALGYREVTLREDTLVGQKGDVLRGHEFHYSSLEKKPQPIRGVRSIYETSARSGENVSLEGYLKANTLGSYMHIHFGSHPGAARAFVSACVNAAGKSIKEKR